METQYSLVPIATAVTGLRPRVALHKFELLIFSNFFLQPFGEKNITVNTANQSHDFAPRILIFCIVASIATVTLRDTCAQVFKC